MKISIGAVIALAAASASGFSITMSSYLDNLASTATLTSFSPGDSATAYAPAPSYAAPAVPAYNGASNSAPAPAPYKSSLADQPASTTINYIGTIGGGSQMKSGPNYTGMSQTFRPSASIGNSAYLDNIKGGAVASFSNAASAPANGAFAQAPAPVAPYQSSAPAPAPYQGASAGAPASTSLNYIGTIGGGSQMKPGPNYTGMSTSFKTASSVGDVYLQNLNGQSVTSFANGAAAPANGASASAPAPYQSSFAPAPAPAAPAPAPYGGRKSYMPQPSGRVVNTGIGNYLDALK